jgi:DNA mismatch repair protein MutL
VPHGARPSLVLYLGVPAGDVDVNVHPTKAEVRFRDRAAIEAAVEQAVHDALCRSDSAATLDRRPALPQLRRTEPRAAESSAPVPANQLAFFVAATEPGPPNGDESTAQASPAPGTAAEPPVRPPLWQIHDSYVLAETRSGLLIIDQHSAHERILFHELMGRFSDGGGTSQRLLFPITLRLSPGEYSVVDSLGTLFERAGFEIEPFGGRTVIVSAAPNPHAYFDTERCLREMISELTAGSELTRAATNQHERIAMMFACKGAIKAGQKLDRVEMEELFDKLFVTDLPYHDVHGRPTVLRLSLGELERRFGRHG